MVEISHMARSMHPLVIGFINFFLTVRRCHKGRPAYSRKPVTNQSINGNCCRRNRSINGKNHSWLMGESAARVVSLQQLDITHRQQPVFLFKAFGEVGGAGKSGIECYLGNVVVLFFHQVFGFFKPEFFQQYVGR